MNHYIFPPNFPNFAFLFKTLWATLSLTSIGCGALSSILAALAIARFDKDYTLGHTFMGITGIMSVVLIVSLVVMLIGWIFGSGHKPEWNILALVSLCTGIVSFVFGAVFGDWWVYVRESSHLYLELYLEVLNEYVQQKRNNSVFRGIGI